MGGQLMIERAPRQSVDSDSPFTRAVRGEKRAQTAATAAAATLCEGVRIF